MGGGLPALLSFGARLRFAAGAVLAPGRPALARDDDGVRAGVAADAALHHGDHLPSPIAVFSLEAGQGRYGGNLSGPRGVVMHVNSELLNTAAGAVGAVALLFLGGWENGQRIRKAEARKDAAADRAALEAQADELVAAVLALKVAGNTHDRHSTNTCPYAPTRPPAALAHRPRTRPRHLHPAAARRRRHPPRPEGHRTHTATGRRRPLAVPVRHRGWGDGR